MDPIIRIPKPQIFQAEWRHKVANGDPHPLDIEKETYELVWVMRFYVGSLMAHSIRFSYTPGEWSEDEKEILYEHMKYPRVQWAIDNSFDGLYIKRQEEMAEARMIYDIGAYLKSEQATFWRLKFSGTP